MELKRRRGLSVFLQLIDSAAEFITPRTPAGVSYITAKPSQTDGHSGGRKTVAKYCWKSWEETREGLWWMGAFDPGGAEGGDTPFQMRQSWCPLCPEQPSLVRAKGNSSSCFRQCFHHWCQNRCFTYSMDKSGPGVGGIQNSSQIIQPLWKDWCQHEGRYLLQAPIAVNVSLVMSVLQTQTSHITTVTTVSLLPTLINYGHIC